MNSRYHELIKTLLENITDVLLRTILVAMYVGEHAVK